MIKEGIKEVYELWKGKEYNIIYLADRWFQNYEVMKYIEEIEGTYCIRIKKNLGFYIYNYGGLAGSAKDIAATEEEQYFDKVMLTGRRYLTKLAVSRKENKKEAIYVLTNGKVEDGIKNYSYRYGAIEFIFKNQKTNGFHLESTKMRNLRSFRTMFGIMCVALLWVTILGAEYIENIEKSNIKIRCYKKDKKERMMSLFKTGLMYFNLCFNSCGVPRIRSDFLLSELKTVG